MTQTTGLHDLAGHAPEDDDEVCDMSFALLELGSLDQIKARTSPAAFAVHVAVQVIGVYQSDGPMGLDDNAYLAPHIPDAMRTIGRDDVADAAQRWLESFPEGAILTDELHPEMREEMEVSTAIRNFLQNPRRNLSRLGLATETVDQIEARFGPDERQRLSDQFLQTMGTLCDLLDDLDFDVVGEYVRRVW